MVRLLIPVCMLSCTWAQASSSYVIYNQKHVAAVNNSSEVYGYGQRTQLVGEIANGQSFTVYGRLNLNDESSGLARNRLPKPYAREFNVDDTEVDYLYGVISVDRWAIRFGRVPTQWNNNLTGSDDRFNRFSLSTSVGKHIVGLAYDVRRDDAGGGLTGHGNAFGLIAMGPIASSDFSYGILLATLKGPSNYISNNITTVSPWIKSAFGDTTITFGGHYFGGGQHGLWEGNTHALYMLAERDLAESVKVEAQVLSVASGSLVSGGYDSYSLLINNNPEHDRVVTSAADLQLGGVGQDISRVLAATRATWGVNEKTSMQFAVGSVKYDDEGIGGRTADVKFVDYKVSYKVAQSLGLSLGVGYAFARNYLGRDAVGFELKLGFDL